MTIVEQECRGEKEVVDASTLGRRMAGLRVPVADWKRQRERASEMEAGEVPISAGTGVSLPWTSGAVLANIQPNPTTTSSTRTLRQGRSLSRLRHTRQSHVRQKTVSFPLPLNIFLGHRHSWQAFEDRTAAIPPLNSCPTAQRVGFHPTILKR
ncbi:hypothetical protein SKAU_G00132770 [Synaphobranchus kaupii]|uniref:Uncharacterized protein n=1 Tax=Synaphobranchus kaupii TaxID=118154 RepID=A0A9Q1J365_SYNKA|nr:hypothetical protein SKAU_G00132770 [Synaphobranchus kaupii]